MVAARVAADADQPTLTESLQAIADSRPVYALHSAGRLIAGLTLLASAWYLFHSPIARIHAFGQLTVYLLGASGLITTISAACTIVLAAYPAPGTDIPSFIEGISDARCSPEKSGSLSQASLCWQRQRTCGAWAGATWEGAIARQQWPPPYWA